MFITFFEALESVNKKILSSFLCNIWNKVLEIDECENQKILYLKKLNE